MTGTQSQSGTDELQQLFDELFEDPEVERMDNTSPESQEDWDSLEASWRGYDKRQEARKLAAAFGKIPEEYEEDDEEVVAQFIDLVEVSRLSERAKTDIVDMLGTFRVALRELLEEPRAAPPTIGGNKVSAKIAETDELERKPRGRATA